MQTIRPLTAHGGQDPWRPLRHPIPGGEVVTTRTGPDRFVTFVFGPAIGAERMPAVDHPVVAINRHFEVLHRRRAEALGRQGRM
jgi:hypothetical protein